MNEIGDAEMSVKISSQRYIDDEVVELKRIAKDYNVTLGKVIAVDGIDYQVIIDGHHSLVAAKMDGVDPLYKTATVTECDKEAIADINDYLLSNWIDSSYYDVETGICVW
jgi:hypothetical protein